MTDQPVDPLSMSTSQLLLLADQDRARSKQLELGMSEVGGCRRRAGYRLAQVPPDNPGGSVQAVMGTAVHDEVLRVVRKIAPDGMLVEHEVRFAGLVGHIDRWHKGELRDTKTTSGRWLEHIKLHGPDTSNLWQLGLYGCALVEAGYEVKTMAIDYLARDTGEEWVWGPYPFYPRGLDYARDALLWLRLVRDTRLDDLPRDYMPDSGFCRSCPWSGTCWPYGMDDPRGVAAVLLADDPDAVAAAEALWQARQDGKDARQREARAKAALEGVRPLRGRGVVKAGDRYINFAATGIRFTTEKAAGRSPGLGYEEGE